MFGYATDETDECMPLTILLAHKLNSKIKELSRNGECSWILPDCKSQVKGKKTLQHRTITAADIKLSDVTLTGYSGIP